MKYGQKKYPRITAGDFFSGWINDPSLSIIDTQKMHMKDINGFILALHLAFAEDLPLTLTPDDFWLVIDQGFSLHINENFEKYRKKFVSFLGKKTVEINCDGFGPDFKLNPWSECFPQFANKITEIIGKDRVALIMEEFTTTTSADTMAYHVVLMDMVSQCLDYRVSTRCGIPEFHIKGNKEDWEKILNKIQAFREFDLDWWVDNLEKVIKKMISIVSGNNEIDWLNSFYKYENSSGGPTINGHVLNLFPYLKRRGEFKLFKFDDTKLFWGASTDSFPSGKTEVPFVWDYRGKELDMLFCTCNVPIMEGDTIGIHPIVEVRQK